MKFFECLNEKKLFNKNLGSSQRYTAFTLAEIIIVIGIVGVVASIIMPALITNVTNYVFTQSADIALKK